MKSPPISGRWWAAGVAVVGVAAVAVPVATVFADDSDSDKTEPTVEILPGPDGEPAPGSAVAASDDGQYIAGEVNGTAALWHNGEYIEIGAEYSVADVNSHGEVAVIQDAGDNGTHPGVWRDGEFDTLEAANAKSEIELTAINDAGDVIGNTNHGEMEETTLPLLWTSGAAEAAELEATEMDYAVATDISEEGKVVGHQYTNGELDDEYVSWMWNSDGSGSQLHADATHGLGVTLEYAAMASADDGKVTVFNHAEEGEVRETDFERLTLGGVIDGGVVYGSLEEDGNQVAATQGGDEPTMLPTPEGVGDSVAHAASLNGEVIAGNGTKDEVSYPLMWSRE